MYGNGKKQTPGKKNTTRRAKNDVSGVTSPGIPAKLDGSVTSDSLNNSLQTDHQTRYDDLLDVRAGSVSPPSDDSTCPAGDLLGTIPSISMTGSGREESCLLPRSDSVSVLDNTLNLQSKVINNLLESTTHTNGRLGLLEDNVTSLQRRLSTAMDQMRNLSDTVEKISDENPGKRLKQLKDELIEAIKKHNQLVKQSATPSKSQGSSAAMLSTSPATQNTYESQVTISKANLTEKIKLYMQLLSDTGGHSLNKTTDLPTQLQLTLRRLKAVLHHGYTLTQQEIDPESCSARFFVQPKMAAFNSVEKFSNNSRLQHTLRDTPQDIQDMVFIVSYLTDAYFAIAQYQPFDVDQESGCQLSSYQFVADAQGQYQRIVLSDDDMLLQDHIMRVIVGEYDKDGKKTADGMMDEVIGYRNGLLGSESYAWKMIGDIFKMTGYVLLALVALTTVLTMAGVTFPAMLVSLAVTAKASFIVTQAINAMTALVAMFGVNLSAGAAAATTATVFASAVTMFGIAAKLHGGPSELMRDKDQAAHDIADVARTLTRPMIP